MEKPLTQPEGLIGVLLDRSAEYGDRDDAAIDLWYFDDPRVEAALVQVVTDPTDDRDLADTCLDSLQQIWSRRGGIDPDTRAQLLAAELPSRTKDALASVPLIQKAPPN